jgi:hypothetical protein
VEFNYYPPLLGASGPQELDPNVNHYQHYHPPCFESRSGPRPPHSWDFEIILRHTALGRTPLDERSTRPREVYPTTHNNYKRQTSMHLAGFEPAVPASERPQTRSVDHAYNGTSEFNYSCSNLRVRMPALFISLCLKIHRFRDRKWRYCTVWVQQRQLLYGADGEC